MSRTLVPGGLPRLDCAVREATESRLPSLRPRKPRPRVGRGIARFFCVLFALLGVLPFVLFFVVRSTWAQRWAADQAARMLKEHGVEATFDVALHAWPLGVELSHVHVASNDGGQPALVARKVTGRPRIFPLFSGKLAIDEIEVDSPRVRLILEKGKLKNVDLALPEGEDKEKKVGPPEVPFNVAAVTDAQIDLEVDGSKLHADSVDVDVTSAEEDLSRGPAFEIAARAANAAFEYAQTRKGSPEVAIEEDMLCTLEARVRYEPNLVTVRRLEARGAVDLDARAGTAPSCDLAPDDKRNFELALYNVHAYLPETKDARPRVDGRLKIRVPLGLAERLAKLPDTDGWIELEGEGRYGPDSQLPDWSGRLSAHSLRIGQFGFARAIDADVSIKNDVVSSKQLAVQIGGGVATLSDIEVEPFNLKVNKGRLDAKDVNFTDLIRDLGISHDPYVAWDVKEVHTTTPIAGTFVPFKIDTDFTAQTAGFAVYDRPARDPARARIIGINRASVVSHCTIDMQGIHFTGTNVDFGDHHSHASEGNTLVGFKDELRVDANVDANLADVSPIASVEFGGHLRGKGHVFGTFNNPGITGEIAGVDDLTVSSLKLGKVTHAEGKVDVQSGIVDITKVTGAKGTSPYEIPTARLQFATGGRSGFGFAAVANAGGEQPFHYTDLLTIFGLENDPTLTPYKADLTAKDVSIKFEQGGKDDVCGTGYIEVRARADLRNVEMYKESFVDGNVELALRWKDRARGLAGVDLDVRSFVLHKGTKARSNVAGTVLGSAQIKEGGLVDAQVTVDELPLAEIDALPAELRNVEGRASAAIEAHGSLDEFAKNAGVDVQAGISVTQLRGKRITVPPSELRFKMHQEVTHHALGGFERLPSPVRRLYAGRERSPDDLQRHRFPVRAYGGDRKPRLRPREEPADSRRAVASSSPASTRSSSIDSSCRPKRGTKDISLRWSRVRSPSSGCPSTTSRSASSPSSPSRWF